MRPSTSLKKEFLKEWIMGLRRCNSPKKNMSILERKKAIKISADIAMASARKGTTCWSRALLSNVSQNDSVKHLVEQTSRRNSSESLILMKNVPTGTLMCNKRMRISKKILKRSCRIRRQRRRRRRKCSVQGVVGNSTADRLVRKKTQVLKSLIPGGEFMNDDVCLIEETLDYIISLRAQVDVMRSVASVSELVTHD